MMIKRKDKRLPEVDVGSFSDIAFLLIIFFILTTQITKFLGRSVDIPSGQPSKEEKKEEDKQLTINLTENDLKLTVGKGEPSSVTFEELKAKLLQENLPAQPEEKRFVILDSKGEVPYERYYKVVMIITGCGGILTMIDDSEDGEKAQ